MTKRRDLLLTGLALAGVAGGWQAWVHRPRPFEFEDMTHLPGWQRLIAGSVSAPVGASFATIGLEDDAVTPLTQSELEPALYRETASPRIAVFSDFFCPFCQRLTAELAGRSELTVNWHELPLLGPSSEIAAQAAIAADLQGAYAPFVVALKQTGFRPTLAHMGRVATSIGLEPERLVGDMTGSRVAERLDTTRRAAATLGVYGTPGMTIERTLIMGEIGPRDLDRLLSVLA